jgi:hypothetical protein
MYSAFRVGLHFLFVFAFNVGAAGPLWNSAFINWRARYARRLRALLAGGLRFAEINTHDFPASTSLSSR